MKLWKKTVALMLITLLVSLILVGGLTLYITGRKSLENAAQTYARQMLSSGRMLERFWDDSKYERMTEVGQSSYRAFQFENCCGSGYALFKDGEVLENLTGYAILNIEALGIEADEEETDYRLQKTAGKYLLLQQLHLEKQDFLLFSVRDITENFTEIKRLGIWFLAVYCCIFLIAGVFIYLMMRRTVLAMERLQETAEKQELLLGALAHEMKTPLTSVIGFSDSLLHVRLSGEQQRRALENINREGRRMEALSAKMLQLMGLYQNEAIELREGRAAGLIGRVAAEKEEQARLCGVTLHTECEDFSLQMDEALMESLLLNLVDNALRASKLGDVVTIRAGFVNGARALQVEDEGCGIPEEELARVTEAFYMVDKSRSRRAGGAGLGLALCTRIAALHHGRLLISSEEGRGTVVTVSFS